MDFIFDMWSSYLTTSHYISHELFTQQLGSIICISQERSHYMFPEVWFHELYHFLAPMHISEAECLVNPERHFLAANSNETFMVQLQHFQPLRTYFPIVLDQI